MTDFNKGYKDGRSSYDRSYSGPLGESAEYLRGFAAGRKAGPSGYTMVDGVRVRRTMEPA